MNRLVQQKERGTSGSRRAKEKTERKEIAVCLTFQQHASQAWELRMEKSAEKWGAGGRRRLPVGVRGQSPLN